MIDALANICTNNSLKTKILLLPSYAIGQNILSSLAAKIPVFNLRIETIKSIAYELGMPLLGGNNEILADDNLSRQLMFSVIYSMRQNNKFEYFTDIQATPSLSDIIWNAVMEIRYAGLSSEELSETSFVCPGKGRDIMKIINEYDLMLKNQGLTDYPGLIQKILRCSGTREEDALLIVPNSIKLRLIEKKLINEKFGSIQVIYDEQLNGISVPNSYYCVKYPEKTVSSPFINLYSPDENRNDDDLSHIRLVEAYGESNEVEAVLRDIISKEVPFDNVCIYTASVEPYAQLLYQKAEQLDIPVSFGYGINVGNTRAGKAFTAVIQWIGSNYQVSYLTKMLYQGLIEIPGEDGETITAFQAANTLRASGIGWGRERYLPVLDEKLAYLQIENNAGGEKNQNRIKTLLSVRKFIEAILNMIPDPPGRMVSLGRLAKGISDFINAFAQVKSPLDKAAKDAISENLDRISADLSVEMDEGLRILESNVQNIRIGISGPEKGHIHITDFDNGLYINRRHHYFIGLDADRFPGKIGEDPVLLDVEKKKISEHIIQNREKPNERLYGLVELISGVRGYITLIYSSFDPSENRDKIPSSFILQVYRMISGNVSADYSDLKSYFTATEGYISDNALDATYFWLNKYYKGALAGDIIKSVIECYPNLKHGKDAWDNQGSDKFTCYDGYVGNLDIIKENEAFSASRLELLAKCPYRYFLRYVLNVSLPDELVYDPETWLDPFQKGSLYHTIFERFYKTISEKDEKPSREKHSPVILEIAGAAIQEIKNQIPPPNEIVFEIEKREILESCLIFLAGEEENFDGGIPVEFELAFGLDDEGYPPVEIPLGSGRRLLLSGKIDRVDRLDENTYRIVDYKSGGTYGYSDRDFFKQGRQLQHALYAYACEVLLRKNNDTKDVRVKEGVYLFPTKKGEGRRYIRVQRDKSKLVSLLNNLFDVMEQGTFAATLDTDDCRWCDYQVVCRVYRLQKVTGAKRNDDTVAALKALRGLNDYE